MHADVKTLDCNADWISEKRRFMSSFLHFKPLKLRHQSETEVSNWVITVSSASLSLHEGIPLSLITK